MNLYGINSLFNFQKRYQKLLDGMIKMETEKAVLDVADTFQKAYNIAVYHVDHMKPMMGKDQFIDTYYPGPDYATLFVEYQLTREEIHDVYKRSYRKANAARIAEKQIKANS